MKQPSLQRTTLLTGLNSDSCHSSPVEHLQVLGASEPASDNCVCVGVWGGGGGGGVLREGIAHTEGDT